jgi:hypothetical protein
MTKSFFYLIYLSIVYFLAGGSEAKAQAMTNHSPAYRHEWANLGLGTSSDKIFNSIQGFNFGVNYNWMPGRITYQAGFNSTSKLNSGDALAVLNAGVGKSLMNKTYLISLVAGPGLMWGKDFDEEINKENRFLTAGLSVNAQIIFKLIKNLGMGLELYTNLNPVQNASGIRISIQLNNDR